MKGNCSDAKNLSSAASIVLSLWLSLSGLAAVTGNAVALWLFYKNESLRTISNRFLASLSVADGLVGLIIDPIWIVIRCWIQPTFCDYSTLFHIALMLWIHAIAASALNSCCVSIDRFIAIRFPFRYQDILSKRRCHTVIILVWFISLSLPLSMLFPKKTRRELLVFFTCTAFVVPLSVVSFCYICIFELARKQFRSILAAKNLHASGENLRIRVMQNFKAIKTVGFVLGACIITWMPSLVLFSVKFHNIKEERKGNEREIDIVSIRWVEAITFTSSAINPLIYYFRNSEFRRAFRHTLHWLPCLHEENGPNLCAQPVRNQMVRIVGTRGNLAAKETKL